MFTLFHLKTDYCGKLRQNKHEGVKLTPQEIEAIDIILDLSAGYDPEDQLNRTACTALDRDFYEVIAIVDTSEVDVAWRLTNNVHESWVMGPKIVLTKTKHAESMLNEQNSREIFAKRGEIVRDIEPSLRSMSVGDILVDDKGVYRLCAPMGWIRLTLVDDTAKKKYAWEQGR